MSEAESIATIFRACCTAFVGILTHDGASRALQEWADSQIARLRIWADSLGVNARGRLSIAYRLRLNAPMAMMIVQLLEGTESCLKSLLDEVNEIRDKSQNNGSHRHHRELGLSQVRHVDVVTIHEENFDDTDTLILIQDDAKENIDLLLDIAADLRRLGTQKEEIKALRYVPVDEEGHSLLPAFEEHIQTQCRLHIAQCRAEVRTRSDEDHNIDHQSPSRRGKWRREWVDDVEDDEDTRSLLRRLQLIVTQRWRVLSYRRHHARSLATQGEIAAEVEQKAQVDKRLASNASAQGHVANRSDVKPMIPSTNAKSEATELTADRMPPKRPREEKRTMSISSTSSANAIEDGDLPPAPVITGPSNLCTLCWVPMPSKELRGSSWKSHVLRDLAPYFCVFTNCTSSEARYTTSKLLKQHMDSEHSHASWSCPRCPDRAFSKQHDFEDHLRVKHKRDVSEANIAQAAQHAMLRKPSILDQCVFCNGHGQAQNQTDLEHWTNLVAHMAKDHMQSLATLSLPWDLIESDAASTRQQSASASSGSMELKLHVVSDDPTPWPDESQELPVTSGSKFRLEMLEQHFRSVISWRQACQEWSQGVSLADTDAFQVWNDDLTNTEQDNQREPKIDSVPLPSERHELSNVDLEAQVTDVTWTSQNNQQVESLTARMVFQKAEQLHQALSRFWNCQCQAHHEYPAFAFDLALQQGTEFLGCTLLYPDSLDWRPGRLWYCPVDDDKMLQSTFGELRHLIPSKTSSSGFEPSHNCSLIEDVIRGGGTLLMTESAILIEKEWVAHDSLTRGHERPILQPWTDLWHENDFPLPNLRHRLTLATILTYAYLHLGGGPWWPYQQANGGVHIWAPVCDGQRLLPPFFTMSLAHRQQRVEVPYLLRMFNADMPSLPEFGKLLFELVLGRRITWESLDEEMKKFEDEIFSTELLTAVQACISLGNDKTFTSGDTIRENERLRSHFFHQVVLKVQRTLDIGFGLKVQDVFRVQDFHQERSPLMNTAGREVEESTPTSSHDVRSESAVASEMCLHDGDDTQKLQAAEVQSGETWMMDLRRAIGETFNQGPAKAPPTGTKAVRIAILDTGAQISRSDVEHLYDDRLVECRSWLHTDHKDGFLQFSVARPEMDSVTLDDKGHGTHGTSVLLDATDGTDIEVYVAQVFRDLPQVISDEDRGSHRAISSITKALYYAVDMWQVDVIVMSCGFMKVKPTVQAAIEHAYDNNVLMLVAATSYDGNNKLSWPARDERVLRIYAADGHGNHYARNPSQSQYVTDLTVLGCSVKGLWLPNENGDRQVAYRSGTSTAAALCAAIAGLIISIARRSKDSYLASIPDSRARTRQLYDSMLSDIGEPSNMGRVLELVAGVPRGCYTFLSPRELLRKYRGDSNLIDDMLEAIEI